MRIRRLFLLGLVISLFLQATPVLAHANLVRSDPEAGSVLVKAPSQVTLEFSEAIDPNFSKARLMDASSNVIVPGPGKYDPGTPTVLKLDLPALPDGVYNVVWQTRSAVDGHVSNGSVGFSIGVPASQVSLLPPPDAPDPTRLLPGPAETALRWLSYLAAALMVGSLLFGLIVWRPTLKAWPDPAPGAAPQVSRLLRRLISGGALALIVISLLMVLEQAWQTSRGSFQLPLGSTFLHLLDPRTAPGLWLRLILLACVAGLAPRLPDLGEGAAWPGWGLVILQAGILLTFSLQGHAAASGSPLSIALDWAHLAAACAWLGGLLPLFVLIRRYQVPAARIVPYFSRLAQPSVAVIVVSGLYSAVQQVHSLEGLTQTSYGWAVLAKSILFAGLIGLGALNEAIFSPRLHASGEKAPARLSKTVRIELALGLLVLLGAGLLTGATPSQEAIQARRQQGYVGEYTSNGVTMKLWVAPARAGSNEIAVDLSGPALASAVDQIQVLARMQEIDGQMNMGATQAEAVRQENGRYMVRGSYLSMAGDWQVDIIVRRPGVDDVRHAFTIPVQAGTEESTVPNPIPSTPASIASGQALYQENCLPCHGSQGKGDGPAGLALNPRPADLTYHATPGVHTDGQLFEWITHGFPGSAMPAFQSLLTDEQRWDLVNFIRTLAPNKAPTN